MPGPSDDESGLRRLAGALVQALLEALAQLFAGAEDREVAGAPRRQPDNLDVVASFAVAASVRLRFLERTRP
jgi:hypothetical protein